MTLRARPVARRRGRAGWDSGDRRSTLINAGFLVAIGLSVVILVGYAGWSWYDDHFGLAATVDGQPITKDDYTTRLKIESFRLDYVESRVKTLEALGRISSDNAQQQVAFIAQRRQQITSLAIDRLVDNTLMAKLAAGKGIAVSEADVDAQLVSEATITEQRHVWVIEIESVPNAVTGEVGAPEKLSARVRAEQALARLKRGDAWDDVARTVSDSGIAPQSGDLGWLSKDSGYDEAFMTAVFAIEANATTNVVEGADNVYRIGRFTESAPENVDPNLQAAIEDADIKLVDYRSAVRGDVIRKQLSDKVVADMSLPGPQRHVLEIYLPEPTASTVTGETGVKVRWIAFSPKDTAVGAKDLPVTDPAWVKAKADADAAYADLKAHPEKFDEMARAVSDEASTKSTGGKQPWYYPSSSLDEAVKTAIFASGVTPTSLLAPVKGATAWFVIQFMRPTGDGDEAFLSALKVRITDDASFKQIAKDYSEGTEAKDGGDLGWIAVGQLQDKLDAAIFSTAVGSMSGVVPIAGGGVYLVKVLGEETRTPTAEQLQIFKDSGFSFWYTREKDKADVKILLPTTAATG